MRADVSPSEIIRESFWLGATLDGREQPVSRLADCIARIRPRIVQGRDDCDDRCLIWALTAITVHLAIESKDTALAAAMFRSNARLLELAGDFQPLGRQRFP